MQNKENIIIGDIHGTRNEFNQLLKKIKYDKNHHRLMLVGDFLDRGPDPIGLMHQIQDMGIETILGNHEEKCLRWHRHQSMNKLTGKENPVKVPSSKRLKEWESLSSYDIKWLSLLPLQIHIKDNWYMVHAGYEPGVLFDKQDISRIIRIRYVDEKGFFVKPKTKEQPKGTFFWAEKWTQPYNVVFGHQRFEKPMIFKNKNNICIGIDTGCCFGGSLTAYNVDLNEFTQTPANEKYYERS